MRKIRYVGEYEKRTVEVEPQVWLEVKWGEFFEVSDELAELLHYPGRWIFEGEPINVEDE